ncbi:hypothetical protein Cgig2_019025 [Carnegiea gigantea]|uniref:Uncharacterized protein n=1 Tax=Carnegiea gigantea TaxID=171969 RepID=A0A9Q1JPT0_9CARY|nr:hypothetical protein Cgig2_019025 [Carnegiea gigantea]
MPFQGAWRAWMYAKLEERKTCFTRESRAATTTFVAMACVTTAISTVLINTGWDVPTISPPKFGVRERLRFCYDCDYLTEKALFAATNRVRMHISRYEVQWLQQAGLRLVLNPVIKTSGRYLMTLIQPIGAHCKEESLPAYTKGNDAFLTPCMAEQRKAARGQ